MKSQVKRHLSQSGSVDITPTWEATLPLLLLAIIQGNPDALTTARIELTRMARIADHCIANHKE